VSEITGPPAGGMSPIRDSATLAVFLAQSAMRYVTQEENYESWQEWTRSSQLEMGNDDDGASLVMSISLDLATEYMVAAAALMNSGLGLQRSMEDAMERVAASLMRPVPDFPGLSGLFSALSQDVDGNPDVDSGTMDGVG